jgi:hypothetical protein
MTPKSHRQGFVLAVSVAIVCVLVAVAGQNRRDSESEPAKSAQQDQVKGAPFRKAYFGDLHVHTGWSNDSFNVGVRSTPQDAYLFAKGEAIRHSEGFKIKIRKPLDFMGVTEHAEYQGIMQRLLDPKHPLYNHPIAKDLRSPNGDVRTKSSSWIGMTSLSRARRMHCASFPSTGIGMFAKKDRFLGSQVNSKWWYANAASSHWTCRRPQFTSLSRKASRIFRDQRSGRFACGLRACAPDVCIRFRAITLSH